MLMTQDLDLSQARFVQFFMRLGCGKAVPDPRSQPVLLQYSLNGGLRWNLLQEFLFSNSSNIGRYIALEIPLKALLEDDFSTLDSKKWLLYPGGTKMPVCGSSGDALVFIEKASTRYVVTTDIAINEDSFLQLDFAASCSVTDSCYAIELEYSVDLGLTWQPVVKDCLPTNVECNRYHLQRILVSDTFNKWTRIILPLPPYARSDATRFRWHQTAPFDKQQTWAIDNVYIGDGCIDMCSGHGRCDENWSGLYCDEPDVSLPTQLKDNFNRAPSNQNWLTVNGGKLSTVCGAVASGMVLHFSGGCSRLLVTVDLNLTKAEFIQFYFMYGCLISPNNRNQGVLLEYSPKHEGLDQSDWAIDNVLISGSADQRTVMLDTFSMNELWMFHDDCSIEKFCDSPDGVLMCGSHDDFCRMQNLRKNCSEPSPRTIFHRFWRELEKYSDVQWAIDNFYLGPGCVENCQGHGDCLKEQCICDPGFSGPNCYLTHPLKTFLKERFDNEEIRPELWMSLEGGLACLECGVLAEDTALYFGGPTVRQAVTQDLDLRGAKYPELNTHAVSSSTLLKYILSDEFFLSRFLQYWGRIGSENNMTTCHRPTCRKEGPSSQISSSELHKEPQTFLDSFFILNHHNIGISWTLLHEMDYQKYISIRHDYILLPEKALTNTTRLRWWQPFVINNGIVVSGFDRAQWALDNILIGGAEINPKGISHEENWSFYPNAVRTAGFCGNPSFHLYWPNKKKDQTYNILSSRELIIQPGYMIQFKIVVGCEATSCGDLHSVMLEYSKDASSGGSKKEKNQKNKVGRSIMSTLEKRVPNSAVATDIVPRAICICDEEYQDNFESARITEINWEIIQGGVIGNGCGQLAPYAHGDSLYFNGCQIRQAVTKALDLTRASKIMFVLQIGSLSQTDSCNTNLSDPNTVDKAVLLQYSINNGITWQVIAQHQPKDFIQAQRVSYNVPL
ncbi:hypothetical protein E2320_005872 [Naja naja]|nr:hypothetical protein E2320_005872 [Naja naja]